MAVCALASTRSFVLVTAVQLRGAGAESRCCSPPGPCPACAQEPQRAVEAYDRAVRLAPRDSRLLYERDQLAKRTAVPPERRLVALEERMDLVRERDALAVEAAALYCQLGKPDAAAQLLASRRFQPWEGGEGEALAQHARCHLALARRALAAGDAERAVRLCEEARACPAHLGEARHLLANDSEARYWLGRALEASARQVGGSSVHIAAPAAAAAAAGPERRRRAARSVSALALNIVLVPSFQARLLSDCSLPLHGCPPLQEEARQQWEAAAAFQGDFQGMAVCAFSEQSLHSALALRALGREQVRALP